MKEKEWTILYFELYLQNTKNRSVDIMKIEKITKGNVLQTNFTIGFPCHFRLEMQVEVEEENGEKWKVPFLIEDKNWIFDDQNNMSYKQDKEEQEEIEKYKVLEGTYNAKQQEVRFLTDDEKELLKKRIFELCEEEMTAQRAVVEENMVRFCSDDFEKLSENDRDKILAYFN